MPAMPLRVVVNLVSGFIVPSGLNILRGSKNAMRASSADSLGGDAGPLGARSPPFAISAAT